MQRIRNIDEIIEGTLNESKINDKRHSEDFLRESNKKLNDYRGDFLLCRYGRDEKQKDRYIKKTLDKRKKLFFQKIQSEWGVYFCPYCEKHAIMHYTWEDEKFKRLYDIEHFLPRSRYSSLSINLYNWLPACMACNQRLKADKDPLDYWISTYMFRVVPITRHFLARSASSVLSNPLAVPLTWQTLLSRWYNSNFIFHPYFWWICKSDIDHRLIDQDIDFDSKVSFIKKTNNHIEKREFIFDCWHWNFFELDKIYFSSEDTFQIFHFIYDKYTKIKDEYQRFKKNTKSIEAFIEYFFASYYPKDEQDILKYSNGKYKKDLIQYMRQLLESWEKDLYNK